MGKRARQRRELTAHYLALAGAEAAFHELLADAQGVDSLADSWHAGPLMRGKLGAGDFAVGYVSEADGQPMSGVVDEERKLNVNKAESAMLRELPGMTKETADAIVALRIDRPLRSIEEIANLPGFDTDFLSRQRPGAPAGLAAFLTVHGDGRVNVNTAPQQVLQCLEMLDSERADRLIRRRNGPDGVPGTRDDTPFTSLKEVQQHLDMSDAVFAKLQPWLAVASTHFTVDSAGHVPGRPPVVRKVRYVVRRDDKGLAVLRVERPR